jgi:hypothetical protein
MPTPGSLFQNRCIIPQAIPSFKKAYNCFFSSTALPTGLYVFTKRMPGGLFYHCLQKAGIEPFIFHDLRLTVIDNWRLQGHDYFRIMAATGDRTLSVFKQHNTVSREELKAPVGENR